MILTNDIIYLFTNVIYVYIVCRFMRAFFDQKGIYRIIELISFAVYYCVISIIYLSFKNPMVTVITNLICYSILTFNYKAKIGYRFIGVVFIYAVLFSTETITLLLLQMVGMHHFSGFTPKEYLIAQLLTEFVVYVVV